MVPVRWVARVVAHSVHGTNAQYSPMNELRRTSLNGYQIESPRLAFSITICT